MELILSWVDWTSFKSAIEAFDSADLGKSVSTVILTQYFSSIWCALIILYFTACLGWFACGAMPLWRALRAVQRALASLAGQHGFTQGFENYDQVVRARWQLVHPWTEFVESLILPEPGSDASIQNTGEVSQYLNDDTVVASRISTIFLNSVPNHLTGAGILGTFIGLAAGVGLASSGLSSKDPLKVTESLQQLLDGASLAFVTSIFGIFFSLVFLFCERFTLSRLHGVLEGWVSGLESRLREVRPENVALGQLREAERQTKQLERFNTDLVFALEQALEEKIAGRLAPQLDKLIRTVEGLREDRSTENFQAIEDMIDRFTQALQGKTGTQFDAMSSTVGDLDRSLKASADAMQRTQVEVRQALDSIVGAVGNTLESSSRAVQEQLARSLGDVEQIMKSSSEHLAHQLSDSTAAAANNLRSTFTAVLEGLAESMGRVQQSMLDSSGAAARQLNESSTVAAEQLRATLGVVAQELTGCMAEMRTSLNASSEQLAQTWSGTGSIVAAEIRDSVGAVTQELARTGIDAASQIAASLQGFQTGIERLELSSRTSEQLLTGMNQFVDKLNTLRSTIESTHREITAIVEPVRSVASDIRVSSRQATDALLSTSGLVERIETAIKELGQHQHSISTAWNQYQNRFEGIDHALQNVFGQLDDGLSRYAEKVTEFVKELDQNTAKIVQSIAAATGELQNAIEDLLEGLPKLRP